MNGVVCGKSAIRLFRHDLIYINIPIKLEVYRDIV
jgi:hypothetical protein